ncbi:hypothetical protein OF83DRAFT_1072927, partial [Amylostereum chailletii]
VIISQLVKGRSERANLFAHAFTISGWLSGVGRHAIDICARIGLALDYSSVPRQLDTLCKMLMADARALGQGLRIAFNFDNMQTSASIHVEQRPGAPPRMLVGTVMMIYELRGVDDTNEDDLRLQPILDNINRLEELSFSKHVQPCEETMGWILEEQAKMLVHMLLDFSPAFSIDSRRCKYKKDDALQYASVLPPPSNFKNKSYTLLVTDTAENTREGVIEFSNAMIRGAARIRCDGETNFESMKNPQVAPGGLHYLMNAVWCSLDHHRGDARDHGSLQSFITLLDKKRHNSEHPDFHAVKSTQLQVLYGLALSAFKLECDHDDLDAFAATEPSADQLLGIARTIIQKHASDPTLADHKAGDALKLNVKLMFRDFLLIAQMEASIKSGDFGRVKKLLGLFTIVLRCWGAELRPGIAPISLQLARHLA